MNPVSVSSAWRDVIYKGNDNYYLEGTSGSGGAPAGGGTFGGANANAFASSPLAPNAWSHLALTYDGATLRLYVNGTLAGSQAKTGGILTSTNQLQIGGDSLYGQYFNGMIDEVRIYNGPLSVAAIQADMTTPIGGSPSDTQPPTAPGTLTAEQRQLERDRPQLGRSHRQRRRHRLPDPALPGRPLHQLHRPHTSRRHRHQLQRHRPHRQHQLRLPSPRPRRRRQPRPPLQRRHRNNPGQHRHNPTHSPRHTHRHRRRLNTNQPRLGPSNRQHRSHRLPGTTVPRNALHELLARRAAHRNRNDLQRHRTVRGHDLRLRSPRPRCSRQPRTVLQLGIRVDPDGRF